MRPFHFLLAIGFLLLTSLPADAQGLFGRVFQPRGYATCAGGNCGTSVPMAVNDPYVNGYTFTNYTPTYVTKPSIPVRTFGSYRSTEDGRVVAPNGDVVSSVGGVEVVSKDWAMGRIQAAEEAAMTYATIPSGCDCKDYSAELAEIKTTLNRIEQRLPYGDENKQSKADREFERQLARQQEAQALIQQQITERALVLK